MLAIFVLGKIVIARYDESSSPYGAISIFHPCAEIHPPNLRCLLDNLRRLNRIFLQ